MTPPQVTLFIVNAIEDSAYADQLKTIVKNITNSVKKRGDMLPHEETDDFLYSSIQEANILLLLLSSDFFADDTLEAIADFVCDLHHKNIKTVVPIVVRKFFSDITTKLATIPHLPTHGDIASATDTNAVYAEIARYIKAIISIVETTLENHELKRRLAKYEK